MELHRNAKLGLAGRYALVQAIEGGLSLKAAAAACRWSGRWRQASEEQRRTLSCLCDRSSRPRRMPRLLCEREQRRICAARRQTGWGRRLFDRAAAEQACDARAWRAGTRTAHGVKPPSSNKEPERQGTALKWKTSLPRPATRTCAGC
jgi:hypothetical protein